VSATDYHAPERELRILEAAGTHSGRHLTKRVVVTWEDVYCVAEESDGRPPGICLCHTYGVCTFDGPDFISVAAEQINGPDGVSYRSTTHIVRSLIREIRELT
jgi:hypothetical protein